eukprot:scaffold576_cov260-Pinguiococcus_pyrenoidosus.AAC.114
MSPMTPMSGFTITNWSVPCEARGVRASADNDPFHLGAGIRARRRTRRRPTPRQASRHAIVRYLLAEAQEAPIFPQRRQTAEGEGVAQGRLVLDAVHAVQVSSAVLQHERQKGVDDEGLEHVSHGLRNDRVLSQRNGDAAADGVHRRDEQDPHHIALGARLRPVLQMAVRVVQAQRGGQDRA